jgi:microcystin-dependent protein
VSDPFLGEIRAFSFGYAPQGWALCNGQIMPISQNQALFSILGPMYGGDGMTTFALPDLRGRSPFHAGSGLDLGVRGGEERHTLTVVEMPQHNHQASGATAAGQVSPAGNVWGDTGKQAYAAGSDTTLAAQALSSVGSGQAHENMAPFLVVNFAIAMTGIFPTRN